MALTSWIASNLGLSMTAAGAIMLAWHLRHGIHLASRATSYVRAFVVLLVGIGVASGLGVVDLSIHLGRAVALGGEAWGLLESLLRSTGVLG